LRNFLQRCDLSDIKPGRQGVRQRFSVSSVRILHLAWELHELGLPARLAGRLAERLVSDGTGSIDVSSLVAMSADRQRLIELVDTRLAEASQTIVVRARGRPRHRKG